MRDVMVDIDRWLAAGQAVALATVIRTWGSAPRRVGARMALTEGGEVTGSVSGGCVEGAVVESGLEVLETGRPQLLEFGVADETAWDVGLACGGEIAVFVQPLDADLFQALRAVLVEEHQAVMGTMVAGPADRLGRTALLSTDGDPLVPGDREVAKVLRQVAEGDWRGRPNVFEGKAEAEGGLDVFVEGFYPPPKLVMVGGVHIAVALAALARTLHYRTIVVDPRRAFGSPRRFPHVDELIQSYPDQAFAQIRLDASTAVATLTHDPKIDDPALMLALQSDAFYVGALGSRRTHEKRRRRLVEAGLSTADLDRIHSPIGLDLGGQEPEEIALAILAQVESVRHA